MLSRARARLVAAAVAATVLPVCAVGAGAQLVPDSVTITSGPPRETTSTEATFTFTGAGAVTDFRCRLDTERAFVPCTSPTSYRGLSTGARTFTVEGYRGTVPVGVSATWSWTVVASGPGPEPPPQPSPEPPPPAPQAKLALSAAEIAPSAPVVLDATGSTGDVQELKYDLDGNGAYETSCGPAGKAVAAFATAGTYTVGVLAVAVTGAVAAASQQVAVSGPAKPPTGAKALGKGVALVGACAGGDAVEAAAKLYTCPATLVVGVAEAVFPAGAPAGACFAKETLGPPVSLDRYAAPAGQVVLVNGLRLQPSKGSRFLAIPAAAALGVDPGSARVSASLGTPNVDLDGGYGPLTWSVATPGTVGELALDADDRFLGLALPTLKTPVVLTADRRARLTLRVKLPKPIERASGELKLTTDNTTGPVIEAFTLKIPDIPIGPLALEDVKAAYHLDGKVDVWQGSFALQLPPVGPGPTVGSALEVRNGALTRLEIEMKKENPGWGPIACCAYMTRLKGWYTGPDEKVKSHYALGAETDLTAGPKILGWSLLKLTASGRLHWHPDFGAMLEVGGDLYLVEKFKMASGSLQAKMGSGGTWVWFEGTADWNMLVFTAKGTVAGSIGQAPGATVPWALSGGVDLCIEFVDLCAGGKVAASSKGAAACLYVDLDVTSVAAGAVYYWSGSLSTFWGCSKEKLKATVGALRRAASEGAAIAIPAGMRSYLVKVAGVGGAPRVVLVGPTGRRIVTPGPDEPKTDRRTWLAVAVPEESATYVDIGRPEPGTWRIELLPGSVPIAAVSVGEPLPARIVTASVTGAGERRVLRYSIEPSDGQQVVFSEVGADVRRTLATVGDAAGEIEFAPSEGTAGVRTIEATVLRDGIALRTEQVARFRVAAGGLPAPRVSLTRRDGRVVARWLPVPGAAGYVVRATVDDGRQLLTRLAARATGWQIPSVTARTGVSVTVAAVSSGDRVGRSGSARLAPPRTVDVPARLRAATVLAAGGFTLRCALPADGVCAARAAVGGRPVAAGTSRGRYGQVVAVRLRLTAAGRAVLRGGGALRLTVDVPGQGERTARVLVVA